MQQKNCTAKNCNAEKTALQKKLHFGGRGGWRVVVVVGAACLAVGAWEASAKKLLFGRSGWRCLAGPPLNHSRPNPKLKIEH